MGGYAVTEIITDTPDVNAAWQRLLAEQAEAGVWWACEEDYMVPGYQLAEVPGDHFHLHPDQVASRAHWQLGTTESDFEPLFACPIGETATVTELVEMPSPYRKRDEIPDDLADGPRQQHEASYVERVAINAAWKAFPKRHPDFAMVELVGAHVEAHLWVNHHTPVGEPTGWVFWGWVNG